MVETWWEHGGSVGAWEHRAGTGIVDWIVHDSTRAQHLKQHHMAYLVSVNPCQPKDFSISLLDNRFDQLQIPEVSTE